MCVFYPNVCISKGVLSYNMYFKKYFGTLLMLRTILQNSEMSNPKDNYVSCIGSGDVIRLVH